MRRSSIWIVILLIASQFAGMRIASLPLAVMPAHADERKILLHCSKQAPGTMTVTNVWELNFDRSTIREISCAVGCPGKEIPVQIGVQWLKWNNPIGWERIDRFTLEYEMYAPNLAAQDRHDVDWSHWRGHCTMGNQQLKP
jgi:hypothetical protein